MSAVETLRDRGLPGLNGARHRRVDAGGVRMHVAELGPTDASPMLLVHGWPQHWWCWRRVAPILAREHRVLMPDLRGHGWSESPADGYGKEQLADDLLLLLDALGIEAVDYVGHDWGGYIGFILGIREPGRISTLLALSTPHPWPSLRDRLNPLRLLAVGAYQVPLSTPLLGRALMRAGLTKRLLRHGATAGAFSDFDLDVFDARMGSGEGARVTTALYRTFLLRELPGLAAGRFRNARLDVPTWLMVGERDLIALGADLKGFEGHAPRMSLERVPGAGHFLVDERPDLVAGRALENSRGRELASAR
jgi:pimeloyl-ACP methyl ester carboxylesterase